jgi:hypothetical protein
VDERPNENRYPLHSVLRGIQETDCGDLADLTPLVAERVKLGFKIGRNGKVRFVPQADIEVAGPAGVEPAKLSPEWIFGTRRG